MTTITNLQAQIDNAKSEMTQKVVQYLQAQTVPVNTQSAYAGSQFKVSVAQVLEATGVNAADLLTALRNDTLDEALDAIDWCVGATGVGAPHGFVSRHHPNAPVRLEDFEFCHWIEFDLSVEDAINIVLEGDEVFDSMADDNGNDPHGERLAAAVSIVCNYLLNLHQVDGPGHQARPHLHRPAGRDP
jgi:hypothetical protein